MKDIEVKLKNLGVKIPEILLPAQDTDMAKWSVVACDQYTSQPDYWNEVEKNVGECPSTLHLIFPEIYLESDDNSERIQKINKCMHEYLSNKTLIAQKPGFIYIDRETTGAKSRKGLIIAVDLEFYDYNKGSQTMIRATEGTVLERIPPRVKIRQNAPIELPHIMILIDDAHKSVIEPLAEKISMFEKLYEFDFMMEGKHISGYKIEDADTIADIASALEKLADTDTFNSKYGVSSDKDVLLFAVGDGNHSLASAKAHWENVKKNLGCEDLDNHPARYALVEIVNVHDDGIRFEPIHRVVFNVNPQQLLDKMVAYFGNSRCKYNLYNSKNEMEADLKKSEYKECHVIPFTAENMFGVLTVKNPDYNLVVGTLQSFLDELIKEDSRIKIDYIHGEDVVTSLGSKEGNMGFYLPSMDKHDLFKTVILEDALPRKTFSMGEAEEKRFYLECRKIV